MDAAFSCLIVQGVYCALKLYTQLQIFLSCALSRSCVLSYSGTAVCGVGQLAAASGNVNVILWTTCGSDVSLPRGSPRIWISVGY